MANRSLSRNNRRTITRAATLQQQNHNNMDKILMIAVTINDYQKEIHEAIAKIKSATGLDVEVSSFEKVINSYTSNERISISDIIYNEVEQLGKIKIAQKSESKSKFNRKGGLKNKKNWRY